MAKQLIGKRYSDAGRTITIIGLLGAFFTGAVFYGSTAILRVAEAALLLEAEVTSPLLDAGVSLGSTEESSTERNCTATPSIG